MVRTRTGLNWTTSPVQSSACEVEPNRQSSSRFDETSDLANRSWRSQKLFAGIVIHDDKRNRICTFTSVHYTLTEVSRSHLIVPRLLRLILSRLDLNKLGRTPRCAESPSLTVSKRHKLPFAAQGITCTIIVNC